MTGFMKSMAFASFSGNTRNTTTSKYELYRKEKEALKKQFEGMQNIDWSDREVQAKLKAFARQIVSITTDNIDQGDLVSMVLPTETVGVGDTLTRYEISGPAVYYGTYGAAVRMSRPQFTKYVAAPQLKEVGLKLDLAQIQSGKYSASEMADYITSMITAWRNRLLFVTTLAGATEYSSGGAQATSGASLDDAKMTTAFNTITDEDDIKFIIGRRQAITELSLITGYSEVTKREFETTGQIGTFRGVPVIKVNSWTDLDYGAVHPMPATDLWIVSNLPPGVVVQEAGLRSSDEVILQSETLNMYFRWSDGYTIWHTDRIARLYSVS